MFSLSCGLSKLYHCQYLRVRFVKASFLIVLFHAFFV